MGWTNWMTGVGVVPLFWPDNPAIPCTVPSKRKNIWGNTLFDTVVNSQLRKKYPWYDGTRSCHQPEELYTSCAYGPGTKWRGPFADPSTASIPGWFAGVWNLGGEFGLASIALHAFEMAPTEWQRKDNSKIYHGNWSLLWWGWTVELGTSMSWKFPKQGLPWSTRSTMNVWRHELHLLQSIVKYKKKI